MRKNTLFIALIGLFLILISGCTTNNKINKNDYAIARQSYFMYLDTNSTVTVEYKISEKTSDQVKKELDSINAMLFEIEKEFSIEQTPYMIVNNILESTLMKINRLSGKEKVEVSNIFLDVLNKVKIINSITKDFDPTIGALSRLWDISNKAEYCNQFGLCNIPSSEDILKNKELININNVLIDSKNKTVFLKEKGMIIDLGAIAKGYATDMVMDYLKPLGYTYISVNLGGNLKVFGESKIYQAEGKKVLTEIKNPFDPKTTILSTDITDVSIVTSGIYERFFEVDGIKYHHILDPNTGYPVNNELVMVTVIGKNSCLCDGLSTGLFCMGLKDGISAIKNLSEYNAIFVTKEKEIYLVGDINIKLTSTGENNFKLIKVE